MKTKEQILQEWLSKDGVGINYTQEQRILLAMEEYAQQDKKLYSEEEVINLVDNILQHADKVIDAITNENTDWDAESLFEICKNK